MGIPSLREINEFNAKKYGSKVFSKRFKSIYGLPHFKLKKTPYFVRIDPYLGFKLKTHI